MSLDQTQHYAARGDDKRVGRRDDLAKAPLPCALSHDGPIDAHPNQRCLWQRIYNNSCGCPAARPFAAASSSPLLAVAVVAIASERRPRSRRLVLLLLLPLLLRGTSLLRGDLRRARRDVGAQLRRDGVDSERP